MKRVFLSAALMVLSVFSFMPDAVASLLISPLQVVMENRGRSTSITLLNTGDAKNTYRLEWVQLEQADFLGGYQEELVVTKDDTHLKDFTVFTPRQVTLFPGEKQTIRVAVRRPSDLPDGEYKSHLKFGIIHSERVVDPQIPELGENEIHVGATILSSYSIPVVYRVGDYDCTVTLGVPKIYPHEGSKNVVVEVPVMHEGIHGAIGLTEVYHRPYGGEEVLLRAIGNTNLFPEASQRNVRVMTDVRGLAPGTLRVVFKKAEGDLRDYVVMAEREFPVGN